MSVRAPLRSALALFTLLTAGVAAADEPAPPPGSYQQPTQHYVAPLSQLTQPSYVPQSVALSGPSEIDDVDNDRPPPAGYTAVYKTRRGRLLGGAITLGVAYAHCVLVAAIGEDSRSDTENEVALLRVPIAGPFLQMNKTDSATANVFLAGLGGAQIVGAILIYSGIVSKERVFIRNDLVSDVTINPIVSGGATGMGVAGRF